MAVSKHPTKRDRDGKPILFHRFMSPPNARGLKRRIYVQCPPEYNTTTFLKQLEREAIDLHMKGLFTTSDTFGSYVDERFRKEYPTAKNLQPSSREVMDYYLAMATAEIGGVSLAAVDAKVTARLVAKLQSVMKEEKGGAPVRRYSDTTVQHAIIWVITVLRWAVKLGDLAGRPEIPVPKAAKYNRPQPYSREEAQRLLAHAKDKRDTAMFLLMFDAGLRKSEMLGLQWPQVAFNEHVMIIDRQRYRGVLKMQTKGGRGRRVLMSAQLEAALKAVRRPSSGYVICNERGDAMSDGWVRQVFDRARNKAGLRHVRIHDGRHHYATRRMSEGADPFLVQQLLGHQDIRTTQIYVHPVEHRPGSVLDQAGAK